MQRQGTPCSPGELNSPPMAQTHWEQFWVTGQGQSGRTSRLLHYQCPAYLPCIAESIQQTLTGLAEPDFTMEAVKSEF
jgi:hypothetical protein